jgi:hypothetical protein
MKLACPIAEAQMYLRRHVGAVATASAILENRQGL